MSSGQQSVLFLVPEQRHNAERLRGKSINDWRRAKAAFDDEVEQRGKWRRVRNTELAKTIAPSREVTGNIWRNARVNEPHCIIAEWWSGGGLVYQLGSAVMGEHSVLADYESLPDAKAAANRFGRWGG